MQLMKEQKPKNKTISTQNKNVILRLDRRIQCLLIFFLALALRLIYLNQVKTAPFFDILRIDFEFYDQWAMSIIKGDFWGIERGVFYGMPLYAYFLAFVYKIVGHNLFVLRVIQMIMGSLSCVFIYKITDKMFNRSVAIIAGVVAAMYSIFIFYDGLVVSTNLLIFLQSVLFLWLVSIKPDVCYKKLFGIGVLIGLICLGKANILLFLPLLVIWLWMFLERGKFFTPYPEVVSGSSNVIPVKTGIQKKIYKVKKIFTLLLGVFLIIGIVAVRNYKIGKDFVPISAHGGINFYIGNNPDAAGIFSVPKGFTKNREEIMQDSIRIPQEELGRKLKPSEISGYWFKKGIEFIKQNPVQYIRLTGNKIKYFLNTYEMPDVEDFYFTKKFSGLLRAPLFNFGIICPLGLLGALLLFFPFSKGNCSSPSIFKEKRKGGNKVQLLYMYMAAHTLSVLIFFVNSRYRLPIVPFFITFAAYALYWFYLALKEKKNKQFTCAIIPLIIFYLLVNVNLQRADEALSFLNLGNACRAKGEFKQAMQYYQKALKIRPDYADVYNSIGIIYFDQNNLSKAIEFYKKAISLKPGYYKAYSNIGIAYDKKGDVKNAIKAYEKAIELNPNFAHSYSNLGLIYDREGKYFQALKMYNKAIELDNKQAIYYNNRGLVYEKTGRIDQALADYKKAVDLDQKYVKALINMGNVYDTKHMNSEALKAYQKAKKLAPEMPEIYNNLGSYYDRMGKLELAAYNYIEALELSPDFVEAHYNLGVIYTKMGKYNQAEKHWKKVLKLSPNFPQVRANIEQLKEIKKQ